MQRKFTIMFMLSRVGGFEIKKNIDYCPQCSSKNKKNCRSEQGKEDNPNSGETSSKTQFDLDSPKS